MLEELLKKAYSRVRDMMAENRELELKLSTAQTYIEELKGAGLITLLGGAFGGLLAGVFWREIWNGINYLLQL